MLIPFPLLGFLPQIPTFLLPHPPLGTVQHCTVPRMLCRTALNEILPTNRGNHQKRTFPHKRGESVEKRAREKTVERGENKQWSDVNKVDRKKLRTR